MSSLVDRLNARARSLGFSLVGLVPARPARRLGAYLTWIEQEMHGRMGYMARPDRVARRRDLNVILPGVQTIICVGLDYQTIALPEEIALDPSRGRISNYAWGADYHEIMTPRLEELAGWLAREAQKEGRPDGVAHRVYVDTGAILERDHAEQAGLGFTGKNTMLIDPRRGSYFFLGEILTTLPVGDQEAEDGKGEAGDRKRRDLPSPVSCGRCTRCLQACPTGAFPKPYVLDARRCISYLTIELKEAIPAGLRPLMGNWVYGCDVCQEVCPFNRFAPETVEKAFRPDHVERAAPRLLDLLALSERDFAKQFAGSPIARIKRPRLLRNACVAAGNWGSEAAMPLLGRLLADPDPLVRSHAAWALGRIPAAKSRELLISRLSSESDPAVRAEIAHGLTADSC